MIRRPMCLLCFLMILGLGIAELAGIPLITGNPIPVSVQSWIRSHPGSEICGEVERYENTEFSQSVYLKKSYLIYHSKKIPVNNIKIFLKKEEELKWKAPPIRAVLTADSIMPASIFIIL